MRREKNTIPPLPPPPPTPHPPLPCLLLISRIHFVRDGPQPLAALDTGGFWQQTIRTTGLRMFQSFVKAEREERAAHARVKGKGAGGSIMLLFVWLPEERER